MSHTCLDSNQFYWNWQFVENLRTKSTARPPRRARTTRPKSKVSAPKNIEIIVNCSSRETRIAVLESKKLMEYRVEREERVDFDRLTMDPPALQFIRDKFGAGDA